MPVELQHHCSPRLTLFSGLHCEKFKADVILSILWMFFTLNEIQKQSKVYGGITFGLRWAVIIRDEVRSVLVWSSFPHM